MQVTPAAPHTLMEIVWYALAAFLAGGGLFKAVTLWLNRHRPQAEVYESNARAGLIRAETRQLDAQASISAGDILLKMMERMTSAQISLEKKSNEMEEWKTEAEKVPALEAENKLLFAQLERMKAERLLSKE